MYSDDSKCFYAQWLWGINDFWNSTALQAYTGCTITIYNRYGALGYNSINYPNAWEGNVNGKKVSAETYYSVIDLKNGKNQWPDP